MTRLQTVMAAVCLIAFAPMLYAIDAFGTLEGFVALGLYCSCAVLAVVPLVERGSRGR